MENILRKIVDNNETHALWLNSLSYMENAGARKISASEDRTLVSLLQLKHAAEEHRHAFYLKKQIQKLGDNLCPFYREEELLAPKSTRQYLHRLDVMACRYLKQNLGLKGSPLKYAAYLFVTYAIEVRADQLYPLYQKVLPEKQCKVSVKNIISEEVGHMEEMTSQLAEFNAHWETHAEKICAMG